MDEISETNAKIFREYIDQVINQKRFDLLENYISRDCIFHGVPYVGLGFSVDSSSGERVIINAIAPGGPSAGHLQVGDEIVRISDSNRICDTFELLKEGTWGQGKAGTPVDLTVRRGGILEEFHLVRGRIESFDSTLSTIIDGWRRSMQYEWPDLHAEILQLVAQGDLLAYYMIDAGTNTDYNASATWAECGFVRLRGGKIVDMWGVEDGFSLFKQLGYIIREPLKESAS